MIIATFIFSSVIWLGSKQALEYTVTNTCILRSALLTEHILDESANARKHLSLVIKIVDFSKMKYKLYNHHKNGQIHKTAKLCTYIWEVNILNFRFIGYSVWRYSCFSRIFRIECRARGYASKHTTASFYMSPFEIIIGSYAMVYTFNSSNSALKDWRIKYHWPLACRQWQILLE